MPYVPRDYQKEAGDIAVDFLKGPKKHNALEVLPTGSGKSIILAYVAHKLQEPVLILQPSKEILEQNMAKLASYGYRAAVYSASKGRTEIGNITLATIGSIVNKKELFTNFKYIIIDECHRVNAKEGMYKSFLEALMQYGAKVLGLSATPYRLASNSFGSELRFLTRTRPKVFSEMIYYVQNRALFDAGYLSRMKYSVPGGFNRGSLTVNSTGADFTDESIKTQIWASNIPDKVAQFIAQVRRKNYLVFTRFIEEAQYLVNMIDGAAIVTGETPSKERDRVITGFKRGDIPVVCNVGVLTTGFDYPELETVILARPTMSLGLYYQMAGRGIRPHPEKGHCLIVDFCGNYENFGKLEDLEICDGGNGKWFVASNGKQLTNTIRGGRSEGRGHENYHTKQSHAGRFSRW